MADCAPIVLATVGASLVLATVSLKVPTPCARKASVAVRRIWIDPRSALDGVPLKVRVAASKDSQLGSALPSARVAPKLSVSSAASSTKAPAGTVQRKALSSVADWSARGVASSGVELRRVTWRTKVSSFHWPARSVAVTRISTEPASALAGVPLNLRVAGSKLSQPGRADPSARVAAKASTSPLSASTKVPAGTVSTNTLPCTAFWSAIGRATVGAPLASATASVKKPTA